MGGVNAAARILGISHSTVSNVIAGRRAPGLALAFKIEAVTQGWEPGPVALSGWIEGLA